VKNLSKTITGQRVCGAEIEVPPQARVNGTLIPRAGPFGG
jgi:hypothetical protein